jgi:hypothetical protein
MLAFILRSSRNPEASLYPVAGRPLLERQLEWLYDSGVDTIFLERGHDDIDVEIQRWLDSSPLGLRVQLVGSGESTNDVLALVDEVGVSLDCRVVSVMSDHMVRVNLSSSFGHSIDGGVCLKLGATGLGLAPAEVWIARPGEIPEHEVDAKGWGARLSTTRDAITLSSALLNCRGKVTGFAIDIPGTERTPGVWVARGVRIDRNAEVVAPAYIGAGSWLQSGAVVGPHCHMGEHVVVPNGASLSHQVVPDNAMVDSSGRVSRPPHVERTAARRVVEGLGLLIVAPLLITAGAFRRRRPRAEALG